MSAAPTDQWHKYLDQCLAQLAEPDRRLFVEYYLAGNDGRKNRLRLASKHGLTINALRIKALRLRDHVSLYLQSCMEQEDGQTERRPTTNAENQQANVYLTWAAKREFVVLDAEADAFQRFQLAHRQYVHSLAQRLMSAHNLQGIDPHDFATKCLIYLWRLHGQLPDESMKPAYVAQVLRRFIQELRRAQQECEPRIITCFFAATSESLEPQDKPRA